MPKVQPDFGKFLVIGAAVLGILLFWGEFKRMCFNTTYSIVQNQLFNEEEDEEQWEDVQEGEDVQQLLRRLGERKHLEDEKIRLIVKG